MTKENTALKSAIQDIFKQQPGAGGARPNSFQVKSLQKDIQLAVTVLLVDLASCDQDFDQQEYLVIVEGMRRIFGTCAADVKAMVNQAQVALANLRGVDRFANLLKDNLNLAERKKVMEIIEDVIHADGVEDGFETYLRHKFADLLDLQIKDTEEASESEA